MFVRESSGKLTICLDLKDLNKSIDKTTILEEVSHKLANAKYFRKMDAKNGYWSINLDANSPPLTTFSSPFQRMPFGPVTSQYIFKNDGYDSGAISGDNRTYR